MGVGGRIPSPGTCWELAICMREPPASSRRGSGTRGGDEAKPLLGTRGAPVGRRGEQAEGRQGHARAATRARARSVPPSPVFGNIDILGAPTWGEDPRRRGGEGRPPRRRGRLRRRHPPPSHAAARALPAFPPLKKSSMPTCRCDARSRCVWGRGRRQRRRAREGRRGGGGAPPPPPRSSRPA